MGQDLQQVVEVPMGKIQIQTIVSRVGLSISGMTKLYKEKNAQLMYGSGPCSQPSSSIQVVQSWNNST